MYALGKTLNRTVLSFFLLYCFCWWFGERSWIS